ncbi:MAG: WD40/YVTN/BNR-like repeat-containing protein [Ignavibacteriaceae bacterium]
MKKLLFVLGMLIIGLTSNSLQAQWVQMPNGMGTTQYGSSFAVSGTNIFSGNWQGGGVFLSTDNGESWTPINNGLTFPYVSSLAIIGTYIFAGTNGAGVFLSTNNGGSWGNVNSGLTNTGVWSLTISGTKLFAGTNGSGVFLSTNNGGSWTGVSSGITNQNILSIATLGTNIFAGTPNGIFLTTNNGVSWTAVNDGLTNQYVNAFAVSGTNIFAGTVGGVFLSTNNGGSWTAVNNGLTSLVVLSITTSGTNVFAGTYNGVFCSVNNGGSWLIKNQGFNIIPEVRCLLVANNYIFAGTNNQSVWRRDSAEIPTGIQNISTEIPSSYSLSQNYPNPFNPSTIISYQIPKDGFVTLKVFDALGREVKTLVNEYKGKGYYSVSFDGSDLSSGVYIYQLKANGFISTKKMLMIK